jgi:hypothetical protein
MYGTTHYTIQLALLNRKHPVPDSQRKFWMLLYSAGKNESGKWITNESIAMNIEENI